MSTHTRVGATPQHILGVVASGQGCFCESHLSGPRWAVTQELYLGFWMVVCTQQSPNKEKKTF